LILQLVEVLMCLKVDSILAEDIYNIDYMNVEIEYIFRVEGGIAISAFHSHAVTNRSWASLKAKHDRDRDACQ